MKRSTIRSVVGISAILSGATLYGAWRNPEAFDPGFDLSALAWRSIETMRWALAVGYLRTPEIIVVLGAVLVLPVLALASAIIRWFARNRNSRVQSERALAQTAERGLSTSPMSRAWLEVDGAAILTGGHEIKGELIRIGRDGDNDLRLSDDSVQQFHAVIRRTADAEFMIIDVGGNDDLAVNGKRLSHARLKNGDRIALGRMGVTFHRAMQVPLARSVSGSSAVH